MNRKFLRHSLLILLLLFIGNFAVAQTSICDSALFFQLRDIQLKQADKLFNKVYVLKRETFPYDITQAGSANADTEFSEVCTDMFYWDGPPFTSTLVRLANAGEPKLFVYCTISSPVINKKKNRFRIQMLSFFGNWGSKGETYFYKKRFGKWKLYKTNIIFSN